MSKNHSTHPDTDKKPVHDEYATAEEGSPSSKHAYTLDQFVENPELEKRILRKVDMRLLPPLWIMYVLNYLDRNNIGNAKTAGMQKDLKLSSSDYSLALSIFFIGYLLLEVPSNMILSRTRPSIYLPAIMAVWGSLCCAYVGVNSKGALVALRFCLGLIEAGFFPGVLLFMSMW